MRAGDYFKNMPMNSPFKPDAYNDLSPYLIAENAATLVAQLQKVFGAKELRKFEDNERIVHMELKIGDSVLMLSSGSQDFPPFKSVLHLYVPDVLTTFEAAAAAGCTIIKEPEQQPGDEDLRGTLSDCAGNVWSVSTRQNT